MSSIDNRIINMSFNSAKAEAAVAGMSKALANLDQKLRISDGIKSMKNGLDSIDPRSMDGLGRGVDGVNAKFVALSTIAITTLSNITNRAVDAGINLAKSLTITPVMDGFKEYELKLGSVQTIMAGTGESLETVNKYLEELNTYSDRTIYSFSDMTENIGKFTNAGVDLKTSVKAIQGVANVAALSGANANEASRAMYNFSQALSSGSVKLIDWKSIENANMATSEFKTELLDSAVAAGTLKKSANGMYSTIGPKPTVLNAQKNFNDSLQTGWMTTEVLNKTLSRYSDETTDVGKRAFAAAQDVKTFTQLIDTLQEGVGSGWAITSELIVGDFEQAKKLWTSVNDELGSIIGGISDARNKVLSDWAEAGGRDAVLEGLASGWRALKGVITAITKPIEKLFPAATGKNLASISKGFAGFMKALEPSKAVLKSFSKTVEGLLIPFSLVWDVVRGLGGFIGSIFGDAFADVETGTFNIFKLSESIANLLIKFRDWIDKGKYIENFFNMLTEARRNAVEPLVNFVKSLGDAFRKLIDGNVDGFIEGVKSSFSFLAPLVDKIQNGIGLLAEKFEMVRAAAAGYLDSAISSGKALGETVGGTLGRILSAISVKFDEIKGGASSLAWAVGEVIKKFQAFTDKLDVGSKLDTVRDGFTSAGNGVAQGVETQVSTLERWVNGVKNAISSIKSFFAPFSAWLGEMFNVVSEKIKSYVADMDMDDAMGLINAGFLLLAYNAVRKFFKNLNKLTKSFTDIVDKLKEFGEGFVDALKSLTDALKTMQTNIKVNMVLKIAVAVALLAGSIWLLSKLDPKALAVGLGGVITLLAALTGVLLALTKMDSKGDLSKAVISLIALAIAVDILATAVIKLAALSWADLAKGMVSVIALVGGLTGVLALFAKMDAKGDLAKASLSLIVLAVAVNLLVSAVIKLSVVPWEDLARGLVGTAGLIGALALFTKVAKGTDILKTAIGLAILSGALYVLAGAILLYSKFNFGTLASGLLAMGATIVILGASMRALPKQGKMVSAAAGLAILSVALIGIAAAMKIVATIPVEQLPFIVASLGAVMLMLSASALLLQNSVAGAAAMLIMSVAISGLAVALALLGQLDMATIGKGLLALAGILVIFGGGLALLSMIAPALTALGVALLLIGAGALVAGAGMWLFATGIAAIAAIGTAGIAVITGVVMGLINLLPLIATQLGLALRAFAKVLSDSGPVFVQAFSVLIGAMITALGRNGAQLIAVLGKLLHMLISKGITILKSEGPRLVEALLDILETLIVGLMEAAPRIYAAGLDMIIGFLTALEEKIPEIAAKGTDVIIALLNGIADNLPRLVQAGVDTMLSLIDSLAQGIRDNTARVNTAVKNLVDAVWDALTAGFATIGEIGSNIIDGIKNGITKGVSKVVDAAKNMAKSAFNAAKDFLGINSPSKEFAKLGAGINEGFAKGIKSGDRQLVKAAYATMKKDLTDLRKSIAEDVKQMEAKLKKLNSARRKDYAAIKKTTKALAEARAENKAANRAFKTFTSTVAKKEKTLSNLAKAYEKNAAKLEAAQEKYRDAIQARDDYKQSIIDQYKTPPDFLDNNTQTKSLEKAQAVYDEYTAKVESAASALAEANAKVKDSAKTIADQFKGLPSIDAETTAESYIQSLRKQIEATREFNEDLAVLRSMGLNDTAYENLLNKGLDAQPFIDNLIEGGHSAVSEVNALGTELANAATDLGDRTSQELYTAGAAAAKATYDGLVAQSKAEQNKFDKASGNLVKNYVAEQESLVKATAKFKSDMTKLQSMGLNKNTYEELLTRGLDAQPFVTDLINSGKNGVKSVNKVTKDLETEAQRLGKAAAKALYQAGVDSAKGLVAGLKKEEKNLQAEMDKLANRMVKTLKKSLGIKSPSREFMKVARFGVMGLSRGIVKYGNDAETEAATLGEKTAEALQKSMTGMDQDILGGLDLNPTITPVLDLSNVRKEGASIADLLPSGSIDLGGSYNSAVQLLSEFKALREAFAATQEEAQGTTVVFNQNNTSPKALSNAEIYRRTKNQLSVAKEALSV